MTYIRRCAFLTYKQVSNNKQFCSSTNISTLTTKQIKDSRISIFFFFGVHILPFYAVFVITKLGIFSYVVKLQVNAYGLNRIKGVLLHHRIV